MEGAADPLATHPLCGSFFIGKKQLLHITTKWKQRVLSATIVLQRGLVQLCHYYHLTSQD